MKRAICFLLLLVPLVSFAGTKYVNPKAAAINEEAARFAETELKIFTGEPDCKYTLISPVSVAGETAQGAFKRLKMQAAKLGANALIQVKTEMVPSGSSSGWVNSKGGSSFGSVSTSPVVSGFAVKCN